MLGWFLQSILKRSLFTQPEQDLVRIRSRALTSLGVNLSLWPDSRLLVTLD